jgi:DNA-binding HxlR family transcriptional regulator
LQNASAKENIIMSKSQKRSDCPVSWSLEMWGDKWSLLIIRDLILNKSCTYKDFLNAEEGIATNILSARLLALEESGFIKKVDNPGTKTRVFYKLTEMGINLFPIILEIMLWSEKYHTNPAHIKAIIREAKKDKAGFIKAAINELKKNLAD